VQVSSEAGEKTHGFVVTDDPKGGVSILSSSGGAGALLADHSSEFDVPLSEFSATTAAALEKVLPDFARKANPIDLTGQIITTTPTTAADGRWKFNFNFGVGNLVPALLDRTVSVALPSGASRLDLLLEVLLQHLAERIARQLREKDDLLRLSPM
jgi:hypothetical protein